MAATTNKAVDLGKNGEGFGDRVRGRSDDFVEGETSDECLDESNDAIRDGAGTKREIVVENDDVVGRDIHNGSSAILLG